MSDQRPLHTPLWDEIKTTFQKHRFPEAILFVTASHPDSKAFTRHLVAMLFCESDSAPCGHCRACRLQANGAHPDFHWISQETPGRVIKIDQIRAIQNTLAQTPQLASHQLVVIERADKLNASAANALLKMLEEPPSQVIFILIAEQTGTIPATILSRCQKRLIPTPALMKDAGYMNYFEGDEASKRGLLMKDASSVITTLYALAEGSVSPITVASNWSSYALDDLLWLLYLITAQAIHYRVLKVSELSSDNPALWRLSCLFQPMPLFHQLERVHALIKKMNHNINMNSTLVLEHVLMGYAGDV